jgi:hypothetical protein
LDVKIDRRHDVVGWFALDLGNRRAFAAVRPDDDEPSAALAGEILLAPRFESGAADPVP